MSLMLPTILFINFLRGIVELSFWKLLQCNWLRFYGG